MIPTMIVVGLVLSLIPEHWDHRVPATAAVAVLGSLAFGLGVGESLGGTLLALVNVAVGVLVGLGLQKINRAAVHLPARRWSAHWRPALRKRAAAMVLAATVGVAAACTDSDPDDVWASDAELQMIADGIQSATGPAAAVSSTTEDLGLVVIAIQGPETDVAAVVEDTCQAILEETDGPLFSFLVLTDEGAPSWHGSTDDLERCPPR